MRIKFTHGTIKRDAPGSELLTLIAYNGDKQVYKATLDNKEAVYLLDRYKRKLTLIL